MTSEEWTQWVGIDKIDDSYSEDNPNKDFIEIHKKILEEFPTQVRKNGLHRLSESLSIFVHHSTEIVAISVDGKWSFLNNLYERIARKELNLTKE